MCIGDHGIGRDYDPAFACKLIRNVRQPYGPIADCVPTFSFWSAVNTAIWRSVILDHCINCCRHCITETLEYSGTHKPTGQKGPR